MGRLRGELAKLEREGDLLDIFEWVDVLMEDSAEFIGHIGGPIGVGSGIGEDGSVDIRRLRRYVSDALAQLDDVKAGYELLLRVAEKKRGLPRRRGPQGESVRSAVNRLIHE